VCAYNSFREISRILNIINTNSTFALANKIAEDEEYEEFYIGKLFVRKPI